MAKMVGQGHGFTIPRATCYHEVVSTTTLVAGNSAIDVGDQPCAAVSLCEHRHRSSLSTLAWAAYPALPPRFNIAPTQDIAVVRQPSNNGSRELALLRWGLIPAWAKDPAIGNRMINARAETVATKPAFRTAFRRRRCLVLADGFYEWKPVDTRKQPYFIHRHDDAPMGLAGLWDSWQATRRSGTTARYAARSSPLRPISSCVPSTTACR